MCEILFLLLVLAFLPNILKSVEFLSQIAVLGLALIVIFCSLFFLSVVFIEQPLIIILTIAMIVGFVWLIKHRQRESAALSEKKRLSAHQQYMTEYFEKRDAILKQFDYLK
jgi:uncharacterized protein YacL